MSPHFAYNSNDDPDGIRIERTRHGLLAALMVIDEQGWDGPTGRSLLGYVHDELVRPLARSHGLQHAALAQACATGCEVAWEQLADPRIRQVASPWGVVWAAVRRAMLTEIVASRYGTGPRQAWRLRAQQRDGSPTAVRLISLDAVQAAGWDPPIGPVPSPAPGPYLSRLIEELAAVGWDRELATDAVVQIAGRRRHPRERPYRVREVAVMAEQFGLAKWQVRRLMQLVQGAPGWPGVVERLVVHGPGCLQDPALRAAVHSTVAFADPPPSRATATPVAA